MSKAKQRGDPAEIVVVVKSSNSLAVQATLCLVAI